MKVRIKGPESSIIVNHSIKARGIFLTVLFFLLSSQLCFSQRVPAEIMIGDLKLHINERARKQIQQEVDKLTRSPAYFDILVDRMNLYFPFIEREHKKGGVPDQIKFLAIQESALISDAVSSANAVGFWQFKDFTGREVGLRVDRNVDERLNIVSSSKGSAQYFNRNNLHFNNWAYAVIAYHAGAGGAKKHTNEKNYGAKKITITTGSYWYLKKFIAYYIAFYPSVGLPHSEGIWLDEITNAGGKTLNQIAKEQKVDLEELQRYNKWLKRGRIPTDKTYSVLLPKTGTPPNPIVAKEEIKVEEENMEPPNEKILPSEIKPGIMDSDRPIVATLNGIPSILARPNDNINTLATRGGISEKKFKKYNDLSYNGGYISPNEFFYLKKKKVKSKVGIHVAKKGETLWSISQRYGIKISKLARKNRISLKEEIKEGRILWLNKTRPSSESVSYYKPTDAIEKILAKTSETKAELTPILVPIVDSTEELRKVKIHTVAKGESLWSIAKLYKVEVDDLLRWNELPNPDGIRIGYNLQVKAPIAEAVADKSIINHIVEHGETMYAISKKYDMTVDEIMDLNNMKDFSLDVGQELKVFEKKD